MPIHELTLEAVTKGEPAKLLGLTTKTTSETSTNTTETASSSTISTNETKVASATTGGDEDEAEDENAENRLEPQLRETLNVLNDYLDLLAAKGNRWVMDHRAPRTNCPELNLIQSGPGMVRKQCQPLRSALKAVPRSSDP